MAAKIKNTAKKNPAAKKPAASPAAKKPAAKKSGEQAAGRPTKYATEYDQMAFQLSLLGSTDEAIANYLSISTATLNTWKNMHPTFLDALKKGKDYADSKVASALFKKAIDGDVTAQIFWLKNRQRGQWSDRQTRVLENPDGSSVMSANRVEVVFREMKQ